MNAAKHYFLSRQKNFLHYVDSYIKSFLSWYKKEKLCQAFFADCPYINQAKSLTPDSTGHLDGFKVFNLKTSSWIGSLFKVLALNTK
jgi:hypothetical protein